MTPVLFLLLILAGGVGACVRYVVDSFIKSRTPDATFPWSTAIISVTGSFVLGLLTGLVVSRIASNDVSAVVGTGFLGGYTTFSTASYEAVHLVREKHYGAAFAYVFGILVAGIVVAYAGYRWGAAL